MMGLVETRRSQRSRLNDNRSMWHSDRGGLVALISVCPMGVAAILPMVM